jgi:diacylglycerol O-acyltransferase / wax synthase
MTTIHRLSALDAAFLDMETERTPMHVAAVGRIDGGGLLDARGHVRLSVVCRHVASRLHLVPRLRQVVHHVPFGLGRPVWIDDENFDLANHVRVVRIDPPGNEAQLYRLACEQSMLLLDRGHPLWELVFVEGLADGSIGLIEKVHHALVDGVAAVGVTAVLADLEPKTGVERPRTWTPAARPTDRELAADAAAEIVSEPIHMVRHMLHAAAHPIETTHRALGFSDGLRTLIHTAPSSAFNQPVGMHRTLARVSIPLATVKKIAHAHGAKVNDVVLALVAGGLRAALNARGEPCVDVDALVPHNVRAEGEELALENLVTAFIVPLPVHEPDSVQRVALVRNAMRERRRHHQSEAMSTLESLSNHLPPASTAALARMVHHQPFVNVVVTNVPGPASNLYVLGGQLTDLVPIVPLAGNLTIGFAVLSYAGQLAIGVFADVDACPDVALITTKMAAELDHLARCVTPKTSA